ncbi:MAG TPA: putative baseplate assembly protein [Methanothrix sp.]|nr:putative baseplate assembly protein [Methanothrix sp.]
MGTQYYCKNEKRRAMVRDRVGPDEKPLLNGIDYLEVTSDQTTLEVHFIHNLPGQEDGVPADSDELSSKNVVIEGGVRVRDVRVESVESDGKVLTVDVNVPGDFSNYKLRLVQSPGSPDPPKGFDKQLSEVQFSFKVNCPSDFDCKAARVCPTESFPEPHIDYLAKDYASFRNLILDRLSVIMPDWRERSPADLGIVLAELLAYAGDYLSYYQDAVATEAYLTTARKRVSVRRHARLLDYHISDGCNSKAWVCFELDGDDPALLVREDETTKQRTKLLTSCSEGAVLDWDDWQNLALEDRPEVFELLHDVTLYPGHSKIKFYTWDDDECCLPKGATRATLIDDGLNLQAGDVLIFEELRGPQTGDEADPAHRQAVRLIDVSYGTDPLNEDKKIAEIEWHHEDALKFPLCISTRSSLIENGEDDKAISCVRGNVVLADHGCTRPDEDLVPAEAPSSGRYRPRLQRGGLTFSADYDHNEAKKTSAFATIGQDPHQALPAVELTWENDSWRPRRDLLNSDRFATEFVVEMEDDGRSQLRFGDDVMGRQPTPGTRFKASYRVGSGSSGNVGAEAIRHLVLPCGHPVPQGEIKIRNPLPTQGGTDPEPTYQVSLYAPQAFRRQERAVTEDDYAEVAERHSDVLKAVATLRWTGSWYTIFVSVDRKEGRKVDREFERDLRDFLERFRLAGHDIEIEGPRFVPLDIAFKVCVAPGYLKSNVKQTLLETFSNVDLPERRRGFFHPDNFTFGQPVYLSRLVATAMQVPGVLWVETLRFQRWGHDPRGEIDAGMIEVDQLEIARLENDPSFPENGKIEFLMTGGM